MQNFFSRPRHFVKKAAETSKRADSFESVEEPPHELPSSDNFPSFDDTAACSLSSFLHLSKSCIKAPHFDEAKESYSTFDPILVGLMKKDSNGPQSLRKTKVSVLVLECFETEAFKSQTFLVYNVIYVAKLGRWI
jgi:hypothetical protein